MANMDRAANPSPARHCQRVLFAILALTIMVLAVYGNSFDCSWHFDDEFNVRNNPNLHMRDLSWDSIRQTLFSDRNKPHMPYRPIAGFTFALNHYFGRLDVFGYHLVNVAVHAITSAFLFLLLFRILNLDRVKTRYTGSAYFTALLATALWAVNPLNTQAVTYIVQRMAGLAAMFSVMALYLFLRARTSVKRSERTAFFVCCLVCIFLAVGSKENAAMLPACILAFEAFILQEDPARFLRRHWTKLALVFLFTVGLGIIYLHVKTGNVFSFVNSYEARPFTMKERLLTQPRVILLYLSLFFYPMPQRLNIAHDFTLSTSLFQPMTTLISLLVIAALVVSSLLFSRKHPLPCFALLFFFLNHVVESTVFPLEIVFEHRNYLPTLFLFLPPCLAIARLLQTPVIRRSIRWTVSAALVLILVGLGHSTFLRNFAWKNELSLWIDAAEKSPNQFRVHHNLAKYYQDHGDVDAAISEYSRALALPVSQRRDEMIVTYYNLGKLHADQGDLTKGEFFYGKALEMSPSFVPALTNLAGIHDRRGELDQAHTFLKRILAISPGDEHANLNMGLYYLKSDDPKKAVSYLDRTYAQKPLQNEAVFYLGVAHKRRGDLALAAVTLQKALGEGTRTVDTHLHLAEVLMRADLSDRAQRHVENAVEILGRNEVRMRRTITQMVEQGPFKPLQPSAAIVLPLMARVCESAAAGLGQWKAFIEKILKAEAGVGS